MVLAAQRAGGSRPRAGALQRERRFPSAGTDLHSSHEPELLLAPSAKGISVLRLPESTAYIQTRHVQNNETMKSEYLITRIHETFLVNTQYLLIVYSLYHTHIQLHMLAKRAGFHFEA